MLKNLFKKYFTDSFFLNIPLVINTLLALVTLPIVLSNLPIIDYGKWQFVYTIQIWLSNLVGRHITLASKRGIVKGLDGTFLYALRERLKLLIMSVVPILAIAVYLKILGHNIFPTLLLIISLYLILGHLFQISFYEFLIAKKRFRDWCLWQILIYSISAVGSAIVALLTKDVICFALFQLGSISILSWIGCLGIIKKYKLIDSYKKGRIDRECVPYGLKLIPVDFTAITANKISNFIIGSFFGFENLAVFSVADKLKEKCSSVIKTFRPLLYADFAKAERDKLISIINRYLIKIGILAFFLTFGFIVAAWVYIKFLLPETFHSAIIYFSILAVMFPAAALITILRTLLESHLRYKELTVVGIVPNLIKISLIVVFGYLWHIIGICFALTLSVWVNFGFYYLLTIKKDLALKILDKFPLLKKMVQKY